MGGLWCPKVLTKNISLVLVGLAANAQNPIDCSEVIWRLQLPIFTSCVSFYSISLFIAVCLFSLSRILASLPASTISQSVSRYVTNNLGGFWAAGEAKNNHRDVVENYQCVYWPKYFVSALFMVWLSHPLLPHTLDESAKINYDDHDEIG